MTTELLAESVSVVLYLTVAALLTAGGLAAEYASIQHLSSGEPTVALWLAVLGGVMLYAGVYGIGYGKILAPYRSG